MIGSISLNCFSSRPLLVSSSRFSLIFIDILEVNSSNYDCISLRLLLSILFLLLSSLIFYCSRCVYLVKLSMWSCSWEFYCLFICSWFVVSSWICSSLCFACLPASVVDSAYSCCSCCRYSCDSNAILVLFSVSMAFCDCYSSAFNILIDFSCSLF